MTQADIQSGLVALEPMKLEELRLAWVRRVKTSPPRISAGLLRLALAYALQSKALGGVTKSADRKLRELAAGISGPPPGTRLSRSWQGKLHVVTVTDEGRFSWQGKDWKTLSEVANAITGSHWSGPAFFGTRAKRAA